MGSLCLGPIRQGCSYSLTDLGLLQVVRWLTQCGNGVVEGEEQCDDGNLDSGDGCSVHCKVYLSFSDRLCNAKLG